MVIVTSSENNENSKLDSRFARCKFFAVHNQERDSFTFYENELINASHGAGPQAVQKIVKLGGDVLITGNVGPNALNILQSSKIEVFRGSPEKSIRENVEDYKNGLLEQIDASTVRSHW